MPPKAWARDPVQVVGRNIAGRRPRRRRRRIGYGAGRCTVGPATVRSARSRWTARAPMKVDGDDGLWVGVKVPFRAKVNGIFFVWSGRGGRIRQFCPVCALARRSFDAFMKKLRSWTRLFERSRRPTLRPTHSGPCVTECRYVPYKPVHGVGRNVGHVLSLREYNDLNHYVIDGCWWRRRQPHIFVWSLRGLGLAQRRSWVSLLRSR